MYLPSFVQGVFIMSFNVQSNEIQNYKVIQVSKIIDTQVEQPPPSPSKIQVALPGSNKVNGTLTAKAGSSPSKNDDKNGEDDELTNGEYK